MAAIVENNPQILRMLERLQSLCHEAVASGDYGNIIFKDLPYFPGGFGRLETARTISLDLTKLAAKP